MIAKMRSFLLFFIPFLLFFFYFTNQSAQHHLAAHSMHDHGFAVIPEGYDVPSVSIYVTQDHSNSWLLEVETQHFTFTPKKVGDNAPSYHEGHAHLYINGRKVSRLYGKYYDLGELKPGTKITVTLNANNHAALVYNGQRIEASAIVDATLTSS